MNALELRLYGTEFCHLCEEAEAVLRMVGVDAEYADIVDDEELLERYGARIPVLQRLDSGAELSWPFDGAAVLEFLA